MDLQQVKLKKEMKIYYVYKLNSVIIPLLQMEKMKEQFK